MPRTRGELRLGKPLNVFVGLCGGTNYIDEEFTIHFGA